MSSGLLPEPPIPCHLPVVNQPAWDLALLYPLQGQWSQEQYLKLTDETNWLIEFTAGKIEVLRMPTLDHQLILTFLLTAINGFARPKKLGVALPAPTRVYLDPDKYREPDLVFNLAERHARSGRRFYQGADLVIEIVSDDPASQKRDYEDKVADYAAGGIPEYWIVDPTARQITVLVLDGHAYQELGEYRVGQNVSSRVLTGFTVNVEEVFRAGEE